MSASDIPPKAKDLHQMMIHGLHQRIARDTEEYNSFVCFLATSLLPGEIKPCKNVIELLQKLEVKGIIEVGDYEQLKYILKNAGLGEPLEFVKTSEQGIAQALSSTGKSEAGPFVQTPEPQSLTSNATTGPSKVGNKDFQFGSGAGGNYIAGGDIHIHKPEGDERNPP